jgi:DNA-binding NarL/FixJ family response regulator
MPVAYKLTDEDRRQIIELHKAGLSDFQIALQMNLYPNTIRYHINRIKQGKQPRKLRKVAK